MAPKKIKVGIIDDEVSYRQGFSALMKEYSRDFIMVFEAGDAKTAHQELRKNAVDIVILDLKLKGTNGEELYDYICRMHPGVNVIILTSNYNESYILRFVRKQVPSILPKAVPFEEIITAAKAVYNGGHYFTQETSEVMLKAINRSASDRNGEARPDLGFNFSEIQVIKLMCLGYDTKKIAQFHGGRPRAIEFNRYQIWKKTGIKNHSIDELILFALKNEIISIF
jgi:DNA-binding NarL/FixJ family response regulator